MIDGCPGNWCTRCITTKKEERRNEPDDDHDELNAQRIPGVPTILFREIALNLPGIDTFLMIFLIWMGHPVGEGSKGAKGGRNDRRLRQTVKVYLPSSSSYTEKCRFMDKRVREISRFFVAPRREFAPAV